MKGLQVLIILSLLFSCKPNKEVCEFTSANLELVIYNNILTDLIENHMHGRYLGGKEEQIRETYYYDKEDVDTTQMNIEFVKAHNDIFNNPDMFCTLYLDTLTRQQFFYDSVRIEHDLEFKRLVAEYTNNPRAAVDSLNALQRYSPDDFALCTSRIDRVENWKNDSTCSFGRIRLSKLLLNQTKDKGVLFYDWHCGSLGLCGHSGIVKFTKGTKKWGITGFQYRSVY